MKSHQFLHKNLVFAKHQSRWPGTGVGKPEHLNQGHHVSFQVCVVVEVFGEIEDDVWAIGLDRLNQRGDVVEETHHLHIVS